MEFISRPYIDFFLFFIIIVDRLFEMDISSQEYDIDIPLDLERLYQVQTGTYLPVPAPNRQIPKPHPLLIRSITPIHDQIRPRHKTTPLARKKADGIRNLLDLSIAPHRHLRDLAVHHDRRR